jgi:hypothetical protein
MKKLEYEDWLEKYFFKDDDHWTPAYEIQLMVEPRNLSKLHEKELDEYYLMYVNGTEEYLKYEE